MSEVDFIIVGQGLAGITLATHLHKMGKKIVVFDRYNRVSSSRVAAGLYNPITGRKMVKTWRADDLFPYVEEYYGQLEKNTKVSFLFRKPIYRPFKSLEEQNEWSGRSSDPSYTSYIKSVFFDKAYPGVNDPLGGLLLQNCGYLDVNKFLDSVLNYLKNDGIQIESESFNLSYLKIDKTKVHYSKYIAEKIIFCDGVEMKNSPYFSYLPFAPVKGEILEIESKLNLDVVANRGIFVIPLGESRFRVGSTYDNYDMTLEPTNKAKEVLEDKLKELITVNYEVREHTAGIRPATKDRKPLLGMHPKYKNVGIFNGLGAKGVSLAPFYASQFARHLVYQSELDSEVDIARYEAQYQK